MNGSSFFPPFLRFHNDFAFSSPATYQSKFSAPHRRQLSRKTFRSRESGYVHRALRKALGLRQALSCTFRVSLEVAGLIG